jgi:hypothetical protein
VKRCVRCEQTKPLADFTRHKRTSDGLSSWCKDCHNAATREWRRRKRQGDQ